MGCLMWVQALIILIAQWSWRDVYWFHLVRLSVCGQNPVHSVCSTILAGSISYLHILSSNFRRCVACNFFLNQKPWSFDKFFKFVTLTLSCIDLGWGWVGVGGGGLVGCVSSEPRHSSCSSLCFLFCLSHCSVVCFILLYWTTLLWHFSAYAYLMQCTM